MDIGRNIKHFRELKELSQGDLVEKLNAILHTDYKRNNISNYETGVSTPPLEVLVQIAKILGTTLDDLVGNYDSAATPSDTNESDINSRISFNPHKIIAECLPSLPKRSQLALSKVGELIHELEQQAIAYEKDKNKALLEIVKLHSLAKSLLKSLDRSGIKVDENALPDDPLKSFSS